MGEASFDFEGETALVTGGSSGIGRTIALRFAECGAAVLNASERPDAKDEDADRPTHERIREEGGEAAYVECDVRDVDQIEAAAAAAREYGGVDVWVNNAGVHISGSVREITRSQFDRIHEINVRGYFFGVQAAANDMLDRSLDGGAIVNLASISSTMAKPEQIAYESTKGAVRMITRSAALELADDGIRVNGVAPGRTLTEFGSTSADEKERSVAEGELLKPIPMGRAAYPGDCAEATLFLASDNAEYITGELLYVDGGYQVV